MNKSNCLKMNSLPTNRVGSKSLPNEWPRVESLKVESLRVETLTNESRTYPVSCRIASPVESRPGDVDAIN